MTVIKDAPYADSIQIGGCDDPDCDAVHVVLLDKEGKVLASGTLSAASVPSMVGVMFEVIHRKHAASRRDIQL